MTRPLFVFDTCGELEILDQAPTEDFEAVDDGADEIDVEGGEYTAFDIDGQLLDFVYGSRELRDRYRLTAAGYLLVATREFDLPRLLQLARGYASRIGYEFSEADELLELANRARRMESEYESWERDPGARWPWWRYRRVTRGPFEPFSRGFGCC